MHVIGIEPNDDMRQQAQQIAVSAGMIPPEYRTGRAEATGLPDACTDAVLAAQAFHWFNAEPAMLEFLRILKPGGWLALIWNERDRRDPFTNEYGQILGRYSTSVGADASQSDCGEQLLHSSHYTDRERVEFAHCQQLDFDSLLGRCFSTSFSPREPQQRKRLARELRELFDHSQVAGEIAMQYMTVVYTGRNARIT
jgi:ubiquinone/menaquinone biosynthesis C-methylase UbiE